MNLRHHISYIVVLLGCYGTVLAAPADSTVVQQQNAWRVEGPLGTRIEATVDTLHSNYAQEFVPSEISDAWACTGNFGAEGYNMIFFDREQQSPFFFRDALGAWIPSERSMRFYNTHIPMTLLSYATGGSKETTQDRLRGDFSGNINEKAQIGAKLDYLYSKGSYNYQAAKNFVWGFSGSYIGDRYEFQGYYNHYNSVNKENGGIEDDLYITDPAQVQGGSTKVDTKSIPTNLTAAHSRVKGGELWMNHRYKVGFWKEEYSEEYEDSIISREYVPVTAFSWTMKYNYNSHLFLNTSTSDNNTFWENTYLDYDGTRDFTSYRQLRNTVAISLMEGFNKYAKAGLSAFLTHEIRSYKQTPDTLELNHDIERLTPYPYDTKLSPKANHNYVWVGAQLIKQQGLHLNYNATAELGIVGRAAGEVKLNGDITTRIKLLGDTVSVNAFGAFSNTTPEYLMENYVSNHFIWRNDFSKIRRYRAGGSLNIPHTGTFLMAGIENLQNYIYFNEKSLPTQYDGNVQIFTARLIQSFKYRALHWDNRITYQTTSNDAVIPLPSLAIYSNLYLTFKIATLHVQMGVDCDYYTKYKAVAYQPATMSFYNQREIECGNYPFINLYFNFKLSKTRFFIMMSHINQGMTGTNYFSMPHYPLNPRRFQMGLSVDFTN
ncbi:MAG: putative porin [Clostridiales bacterium]|nr:putative porin [Clostridiales bacterium]